MQGQLPRPEEAFTTIGDLLGAATGSSAGVSAVLRRAFVDHAGQIPG